jgi:hypothetical protein
MNLKSHTQRTVTSKTDLSDRSLFDDLDLADGSMTSEAKALSRIVLEAFAEPIVFQRIFVDITHSVTAALFLSQAISVTEQLPPESEGWFECSQDLWFHQVGLSRFEQSTARKHLRELNFLQESRRGIPARLMYWVDCSRVWHAVTTVTQCR